MAQSLQEFLERKLVINGFAVEEVPEGIKVWVRGAPPEDASFIIGKTDDSFVTESGEGKFSSKRMQKTMSKYLKSWTAEYKLGER